MNMKTELLYDSGVVDNYLG